MLDQPKKKNPKEPHKSPYSKFSKYSGLAFQMGAIIFAGVYGGLKLDEKYQKKLFTPLLGLAGVIISMYVVIRDVIQDSKNDSEQ